MAIAATVKPRLKTEVVHDDRVELSEAVERAMAQGRINLRNEMARQRSLGIIDEHGNRISKNLPPDMHPDADRDFGG